MRQVSYRGANLDTSFRPIRVGYEGLERQNQRDDEIIRNLKEESESRFNVRRDNIQALQSKYSQEEANLRQLQAFEERTRSTRDAAIEQNRRDRLLQQKIDNENDKQALEVYGKLAKFSDSLFEKGIEFKKQYDERVMNDEYNKAIAEGLPITREINNNLNERQLKLAGDTSDGIADIMAATGTDPYTVSQVRTGNKWRDYGRLKAYSEMAGDQYSTWLEGQLAKLGDTGQDPMKRAAAIQALQIEYLKQNKLYGLSADFLSDMFTKVRTANQASIEQARKNSAVNASNELTQDTIVRFYKDPNGETAADFVKTRAASYKEDGSIVGRTQALDDLFKMLVDTNAFPDFQKDQALTAMTDNGQTYAERFPRRIAELEDKRAEFRNTDATRKSQALKRENDALVDAAVASVLDPNKDPVSQESLDNTINTLKARGANTERLENLSYATQDSISRKFWDDKFEADSLDGELTAEFIMKSGAPIDVQRDWLRKIQQDPIYASRLPFDPKVERRAIQDLLKSQLDDKQILGGISNEPSLQYATEALYSKFIEKVNLLRREGLSDKDAVQAARDYVINLANPIGTPGPDNPFVAQQKAGDASEYEFPAFMDFVPDLSQRRRFESTRKRLQQDGVAALSLGTVLAIPEPRLRKLYDDAKARRPLQIPPVYAKLAKEFGNLPGTDYLDARDLLDLQFKAIGEIPPPRPSSFLNRGRDLLEDPGLQRLLNMPTEQNQNVAILQSNLSKYSSTDPRGQQLIVMATRNGWDPTDLATIFMFETGTMNVSEPGRGAAAGRIGLIQAGPEEQRKYGLGTGDWTKEINGVEAYLLDRGATPGMDINQLYEVINSGSPGAARPDGNGITPMTEETNQLLEARRVEAMAALGLRLSSANPSLDPAYMSPTFLHFYTTGNLTNGVRSRRGEHTDIKQADNPNTPEDEFGRFFEVDALDNYIRLTDPEFGNVTLSDVRRLVGTDSSQDYGATRDYGKHLGWDYPTKKGTKLYLMNGATFVKRQRTANNGVRTTIKLPDGRYFNFLHGE